MKRLLLFIPLIVFLLLAVFLYRGLSMDPAARDSALIGKPLPAFSLERLDAPEIQVTREQLLGEVFLINVWGSWCPACYQEHDQIIRLAEMGVPIIGLNYKDTRPLAFQYLTRLGNPYRMNLFEPDGMRALAFNLGVYGAPETFLVDAEGVVRYHLAGPITPQLVDEVILPEVRQWQVAR